MSFDKNPYNILGVSTTATTDDIKKAFKEQARKYHPDKCKEVGAEDKFKDIHTSYQILIDPEKRAKYNSLNFLQKQEFYLHFKNFITKQYPNFNDLFTSTIKLFYSNEDDFKNDFNSFNFINIYDKIVNKLPNIINNFVSNTYDSNNISNKSESFNISNNNAIINKQSENHDVDLNKQDKKVVINLDIYGKIKCSLKDRYFNRYFKIKVDRKTKESVFLYVPLRENNHTFIGEGEQYKNEDGITLNGDVNIDIEVDLNTDNEINCFQHNNDLVILHDIPLYDYLYGGESSIKNIDDEYISINFESLIGKNDNIIIVKKKGFPFICKNSDNKNIDEYDDNNISRGDLIIKLNIYKLEQLKDKIKKIY